MSAAVPMRSRLRFVRATVVTAVFVASPVLADPPIITTPTGESFSGISYTALGDFGVAVGNSGAIVHFDANHPNGQLVASGTSADLYDVHVVSADFAVASGRDVILIWNGIEWTPHASFGALLPIWATPERDLVLYDFWNEGGFGNSFRNAFDPVSNDFVPGSFAGPLDLTFCGNSGAIKLVNEDGGIEVIGNDRQVLELDGSPVAHEPPAPFGFTAAWLPPAGCIDGVVLPATAFAVRNFDDIYRFESGVWQPQIDIPASHTITGLAGSAADNVYAVGYTDSIDNPGSNKGVLWHYDGTSWTDVSASVFTKGEFPGLTDMTLEYGQEDYIIVGGFENGEDQPRVTPGPDLLFLANYGGAYVNAVASAEDGKTIPFGSRLELDYPPDKTDLVARISRSSFAGGPGITLFNTQVTLENVGPDAAQGVELRVLIMSNSDSVSYVPSAECSFVEHGQVSDIHVQFTQQRASLPSGASWTCSFISDDAAHFNVTGAAMSPTEADPTDNQRTCWVGDERCDS